MTNGLDFEPYPRGSASCVDIFLDPLTDWFSSDHIRYGDPSGICFNECSCFFVVAGPWIYVSMAFACVIM